MASLIAAVARPTRHDECGCGAPKRVVARACRSCSYETRTAMLPTRFASKVEQTAGCWIWRGPTNGRYGVVFITKRRKGHPSALAHRVAWQLAHGPIPDGLEVMHSCDETLCVRPSHLSLGTHAENMRDMAVKGRARNGYTKTGDGSWPR